MNTTPHVVGRTMGVPRRLAALLVLGGAGVALGMVDHRPGFSAQPGEPGVVRRVEPAEGGLPLLPPEPGEAIRAFNVVRGWLDAWSIDEEGGAVLPAVASACLTLRLDGQVVGRAEVLGDVREQGRGVIELAARTAMAQAEERALVSRDVLWRERMPSFGRSLRLSLELGGAPVPVEVESFEQASALVSPGNAGVGARVGTGDRAPIAIAFPSFLVGSGVEAGAALAGLAADVLGDPGAAFSSSASLGERGVRFLAFESVWVAEIDGDRAAVVLHRGGRVFETREVSTPMIRALGERLAGVLAGRPVPAEGSPGSLSAALSGFALARASSSSVVGDASARQAWQEAARAGLVGARSSMSTAGPGAVALWAMVGASLGDADESGAQMEFSLARGAAGEALVGHLREHERVGAAVSAMLAWAGARRGGVIGDAELVDLAEEALRGAYARTPPGEWAGLLPWAGWAEIELGEARRRLGGSDGALPGAAALREIRDQVWRHQLGATDIGGADRDLVGGIVFTRGGQPLPTWHSLRPVAFLATMLGDPRLTQDNEFAGQVLRMLAAIRFLRQLCADDAVLTWGDGPAWGVRASVWTDEQPEEATPLGLLVIVETLESLDAVSARRAN